MEEGKRECGSCCGDCGRKEVDCEAHWEEVVADRDVVDLSGLPSALRSIADGYNEGSATEVVLRVSAAELERLRAENARLARDSVG